MAGVERFRYMWTEAELFTDRIFLPVQPVAEPMLGGYTVRNKMWPAYAVSYEGLGKDFAALVLEQGRDRLKVVMVNLRDQPRQGALRIWQLDHGKYELMTGPDANDDGQIDAMESARTLELARMDAVPVSLPPRRPTVYEFKQVEKLDDLYARADLAVCDEEVTRDGGNVKVVVHNIGSAPAPKFAVALLDAKGAVIASADAAALEAPLDLIPRTLTLALPMTPGAVRVAIDPEGRIPEITRLNNTAAVPAR